MSDDEKPKVHLGVYNPTDGGPSEPVNIVHGANEPCQPVGTVETTDINDPTKWHSWEQDGIRHIRRNTGTSVGYSRSYSNNYDDIDWGN